MPSKKYTDNFLTGQFNFTIFNDLEYSVDLKWIDFSGDSESSPFVTIEAGEKVEQLSHLDQRWLLSSDFGDDLEIHLGIGYFRDSNSVVSVSQLK